MKPVDQDRRTIPLAQDDLTVGKRTVETGRVRVRTVADARVEFARTVLEREAVEIERVDVGREIDAVPEVRRTEQQFTAEPGKTIPPKAPGSDNI